MRSGINLVQVGHYGADGLTFDDVREEIECAAEMGGWIVWMIHGVGQGMHGMYIDTDEQEKLISWLGASKAEIWLCLWPMSPSMSGIARPDRAMVLETERLVIRPFAADDLDEVYLQE